ncbi:family 78 glycoside hydrolase catalytic domain [Algibacter pacificus]|uniref:family 78 glycoside hydrolase catalytic domain n=1 Tax=Algibacter pacificus TaxID=2599389 RepID=UPI001FEB286B|nr:family 78 glycoside hydrolase catalytic domain [Algibacter pacificus]
MIALFLVFLLNSCADEQNNFSPKALTVSEQFKNPIGFYDATPSFSWKLPKGTQLQTAYKIVAASSPDLLPNKADIWNSGKVESNQSLYVKYDGVALTSRQKIYWQVQFWDENGKKSSWSDVAHFELGLLNNDDWSGKWISIPHDQLTEKDYRGSLLFPAQYMRKEIDIDKSIKNARLYITAKGVYEAYINGKKVGDDIMPPGWVPYRKYIPTLTYDVTDMLKEGKNTIAFAVAEGWYAGKVYLRGRKKKHNLTPSLLCQLEIEHKEGKTEVVSDESWKVTKDGPIRIAKIYDGETYDANYELGNWHTNGFDDKKWHKAQTHNIEKSVLLLPKRFETVVNREALEVKSMHQPNENVTIFNMGQNNVGVPIVKVPMLKGDTLKIRFAEMLDRDSTMYTKNYRSAKSTDYYVAADDGMITYKPTFTFHGYQYVELSGYKKGAIPQKNWVKSLVQYSNFEENGTFTSSHPKLNQLQSNISWGMKGNFFDIPTDCPQRDERLGWTGDAQIISPTSMFHNDMYAFWAGWLQSVRYEQFEDGGIPWVVPNNLGKRHSSGWADAIVIIPWELYFRTGDVEVLEENYAAMVKWVNYCTSQAIDHIPDIKSFGDWLQPLTESGRGAGDVSKELIKMAYYAHSVDLVANSARVLGKTQEAEHFSTLHDSIKTAFEQRWFHVDGRAKHKVETQTHYLVALEFELLSDEMEVKAIKHLKRLIAEYDNHLRTGFLGTPILPLVLDKAGEYDLMYDILFKETYPSWFYSINQGATTMWERWDSYTKKDGFHKDGMNSFNHYAYGAIGRWMYERIAGIKPTKVAYKEIEIAPVPGGSLTSASASYNSPYGLISSNWKLDNDQFLLEVTIPSNTMATVIVPGDTQKNLTVNGQNINESEAIKVIEKTEQSFILSVAPGTYSFVSHFSSDNK